MTDRYGSRPSSLCVIQARMGSSRLPGKVLQPIEGVPMLAFMLSRVASLDVDRVVVATSDLARDDPIVSVARECGIAVVRGSETDVLHRYVAALDAYPSDLVVRLTADCPLTDPEIVAAVMATHVERGADYTSNVLPRSFPKGLDVEVVASAALRRSAAAAADSLEREHVTPYLYRHPELFKLANHDSGLDAGQEHWTVDTLEDLERVRSIVQRCGRAASWQEMLTIVGRTSEPGARNMLMLRSARASDSEAVLAWRNDADSVQWSTTQEPVSAACHEGWFPNVIQHPGHRLRIAQLDGRAVGYLRLDVCSGAATVSVALDPAVRGRGLGTAMLTALVDELRHDVQIGSLHARVHTANIASMKAFARAGFRPMSDPVSDPVSAVGEFLNLAWNP